jgi:hypothetical protein
MLEIIIVYMLAKNLGNKVEAKGRKRIGYQLMLIGLWLGGEFTGAIFGSILQQVMGAGSGFPLMAYLCALAGAAIGAVVAFAIVNGLPSVENDADFYQVDERRRDDEVRRAWRATEDRPPADGDQIQERPVSRREDERIQE